MRIFGDNKTPVLIQDHTTLLYIQRIQNIKQRIEMEYKGKKIVSHTLSAGGRGRGAAVIPVSRHRETRRDTCLSLFDPQCLKKELGKSSQVHQAHYPRGICDV
jgi:hypothetical protein